MYKSLKVLDLENRSLDNNVDLISVGSPRSASDLNKAAKAVDANLFSQSNNPLDPVTNPKMWVAGAVGTGGLFTADAAAASSTSLVVKEAAKGVAKGVGTGTAIGTASVGIFHSFDDYVKDNSQGVNDAIKDWSVLNPEK